MTIHVGHFAGRQEHLLLTSTGYSRPGLTPLRHPKSLQSLMKNLSRILLALVALIASSSIQAQTTEQTSFQTLSPGDEIRIAVWRNLELSGDFPIAADGTIIHPLYREVQVTGIPLSTVEERLRVFLTKYVTTPQFVIQPLVKIIVMGEVRSPNIYSVPPQTTIAQALALAGGPTERGKLDDVRVIRDRQEIRMDVSKPDSDAGQLQIRSNDQIIMGRRGISPWQIISPVASSIAAVTTIISIFTR
jgi:polysaccharide export outer membrane protein